ncbi:MAG: efflux RND transporter periplasmic adaptor subunit [Acidobacteriota bacterium]
MSKKNRFRLGFFTVVVLLLGAGAYLVFGNIFRSEASLPPERLVQVQRGDLALSVVATGSIVPVAKVEVKSKASGLIKELHADEGDLVKAGDVLVELDKELLQAQVREAEANLRAASARHEEARSELASAISLKRKMEMDLRNLEDKVAYHSKLVGRYEALFAEKLIPHSDLDQRERDLQEARFAVEALKSELMMQSSRIDAAEKAVARVAAEVSQAQASLDRALENLRYATIRSPITGKVLKRHVEVGDAVSSILQLGSQATLIFTLGDMSQVYFEGRVDETDIGKVYEGQKALVRVDAYRDRPFEGKVIRIAPLGEKEDNVIGFEVRVSVEDPDGILRAQMSANAEIIVQEKKQILLIPEQVIIYDQDRNSFAELYDPGAETQRRRTPIEVGISNGTTTEVLAGLDEGQTVVKPAGGGLLD